MTDKEFVCPTCKYLLASASESSPSRQCPRCNTWLEFEVSCSGSCLACTEHLKAELPKQNQGLKDPAVEGGVSSS